MTYLQASVWWKFHLREWVLLKKVNGAYTIFHYTYIYHVCTHLEYCKTRKIEGIWTNGRISHLPSSYNCSKLYMFVGDKQIIVNANDFFFVKQGFSLNLRTFLTYKSYLLTRNSWQGLYYTLNKCVKIMLGVRRKRITLNIHTFKIHWDIQYVCVSPFFTPEASSHDTSNWTQALISLKNHTFQYKLLS